MIGKIIPVQAEKAIVTTHEGQLHGLQSGNCVRFKEIRGMDELNGTTALVQGTYYARNVLNTI